MSACAIHTVHLKEGFQNLSSKGGVDTESNKTSHSLAWQGHQCDKAVAKRRGRVFAAFGKVCETLCQKTACNKQGWK